MSSSAPRMSSSLFHMAFGLPSDLADERLAEDAGGTDGEGEDEENEPRGLAPSAPEIEAGDALQRAEEHAHHHHAETRLEARDHRDREGLEDQRRSHGGADRGDGRDEDAGDRGHDARERVGKLHRLRRGDAHQFARVAIGGYRVERLPEERLPLEDLDRSHDGEDAEDRKSTRLNSSHVSISYAVFCLNKKNR